MYSFIILNYNNVYETVNCLNKLKIFKDKDCHFIVVDNNTLKKEDIELIKKYTNDILLLDDNLGYAKANNKGIEYAKKKYNSDYYIVINNDVEITQKEFLKIINDDYEKYKYDMLGPWIDTPGYSINPYIPLKTKEEVKNEINKCKKNIKIYNNIIKYNILMLCVRIKGLLFGKHQFLNGTNLEKNVALHGCSIIFSKQYIEKYKFPFYNDTFLFHEEDFLYNRLVKDKLISIYDPSLKVFHKEGATMKKNSKKDRERKIFREKERIKSLELLLKEM